jgi:hypothetical protein
MSLIENMLAVMESNQTGKDINYAQIAKLYSVERSTLSQRQHAVCLEEQDEGAQTGSES